MFVIEYLDMSLYLVYSPCWDDYVETPTFRPLLTIYGQGLSNLKFASTVLQKGKKNSPQNGRPNGRLKKNTSQTGLQKFPQRTSYPPKKLTYYNKTSTI